MNWDAISAIAEMLAAAGVIISLAYLSLQVRQNTDQVRHNSDSLGMAHEMGGAQMSVDIALAVATDPELGELLRRMMIEGSELTSVEHLRFGSFMYAAMAGFQAGYYNYRKGFADSGAWQGHEGDLKVMLRSTGARRWWPGARGRFSPEFAQYVDGLLAAPMGLESSA